MALSPNQQSPIYGGSRSYNEMQAFQQKQRDATFQQNLGRFAMFAGLGAARGIGAGLQATDLRNPFTGAGASILGGTEPASVFANQAAQRMGEAAMFPERLQREMEADRANRTRILEQTEEDRGSFRGIRQGIDSQVPSRIAEQEAEEEQPMGLRAGLGQMNAAGKMFMAQQGLSVARAMMMQQELERIAQSQTQPASQRTRNIMFGMQGGMR